MLYPRLRGEHLSLVIVLEILKFKRFRERELRRQVDTGPFEAVGRD